MLFGASIHRVILTLLLFLSSMTGMAAYAHRADECVKASTVNNFNEAVDAWEKQQHHAPLDAVLSRVAHCSSSSSLPGVTLTGTGGSSGIRCALPFLETHIFWESKTHLRRWRIMAGT